MRNDLTFSFFKKKNKVIAKGKSPWKIIKHPFRKDKVLKFVIVTSSMLRSQTLKKIQREYDINKLLMKHPKMHAVMVPTDIGKIVNNGSDSHLIHYVYFIEMDYMDGDLTNMNDKEIIWSSIILQILAGLINLHNLGIKHGDLAPRNILFRKIKKGYTYSINFRRRTHEIVVEDYEIKIADFGLSKTAKSKIVRHEHFKNNLAYLSSSLLFNSNHRVNTKKKFNIPNNLKKKITGFRNLKNLKSKSKSKMTKRDVYDFLRKKITTKNFLQF